MRFTPHLTHQPVLLQETLSQLNIQPEGIYIDATFGRGGHSAAILAKLGLEGRLLSIDQDPEARIFSEQQFSADPRFLFISDSFTQLKQHVEHHGWINRVNGILLDLGVSSPQLENAERGFSFLRDGPLDMRMNSKIGQTAAEWIASASVSEMIDIFRRYGEERYSARIAHAIDKKRRVNKITSTAVLADIISKAHPHWPPKKHPATKVFQAIRIHINQELSALQQCLAQSIEILAPGGRLAVITFHSLEARLLKQFVQSHRENSGAFNFLPIPNTKQTSKVKWIDSGIKPSIEEIKSNPRARSALLRVIEKIGGPSQVCARNRGETQDEKRPCPGVNEHR